MRDYLEGKRKRYFPPFTLVAILALAGSLLMQLLPEVGYVQGMDAAQRPAVEKFNDWCIGHQGFFYLMLTPFMALWTWLMMRKYGHGFVEHVVINTFISAQIAVVSLLTWPFVLFDGGILLTSMLATVLMLVMACWTFAQLYGSRPVWKVILRTCVAFVSSFVMLIVLVTVVMVVLMMTGVITVPPVPPVAQ